MERGEINVDDVERGGCGVANGLNKGCVYVVVDGVDKMLACDVPAPNTTNKDRKSTKPSTRTLHQLQTTSEPTTAMTMAITK